MLDASGFVRIMLCEFNEIHRVFFSKIIIVGIFTDHQFELLKQNKSKSLIKKELNNGLSRFNKLDYDTEEKEFICDYFFDLSQILEIDFKENLNNWLYGFGLNSLMKVMAAIKGPEKVIETLSQNCTKCNSRIETFILQKQEDITYSCYDIVKCKLCGEYNLLDKGPGIKQFRVGNYETIEHLSKDEYTFEQAITRLEQIKYFRKQ